MIVLHIAISSNTIQVYRGVQRGCSNPSVIDSEFEEKNTHVATQQTPAALYRRGVQTTGPVLGDHSTYLRHW
jgi:hypothetical protein